MHKAFIIVKEKKRKTSIGLSVGRYLLQYNVSETIPRNTARGVDPRDAGSRQVYNVFDQKFRQRVDSREKDQDDRGREQKLEQKKKKEETAEHAGKGI